MAVRADDVDLGRDRALVEQCQLGDAAAFEDLYRRYFNRLYRFCLRRVGDAHEAEEVTQEAFTRAFNAMPRLQGDRRFYPWLSVIAARLCVDTHRRRARTEPHAEVDPGRVEGGVPDEIIAAEGRTLLAAAMACVGPRHREVLELREQRGWSYQRIADHYDVSMGTVEALLWRARRALKREFLALSGPEQTGFIASIPLVGWLIRRFHGFKLRVANATQQILPPLMANAVGVVAVVSTVTGVGVVTAGPSVSVDSVAASSVIGSVVRAPAATVDGLADARNASMLDSRVGVLEPPAPPAFRAGAITVGTGSYGEEFMKDAPVAADLGLVQVGANPDTISSDVEDEGAKTTETIEAFVEAIFP